MAVKALILESNPVARECLRRVVAESFSGGSDIDEATNPTEAVQRLQAAQPRPYDLLLLDLEHPEGRWSDVLACVAGQPAVKVVCTLHADDDQLFAALRAGADGYLLKQDRFEVMAEQLQRIAQGMPPLTPGIARRAAARLHPDQAPSGCALSARETQLLSAVGRGFTTKEIARQMGVDAAVLQALVQAVYGKLAADPPGTRAAARAATRPT